MRQGRVAIVLALALASACSSLSLATTGGSSPAASASSQTVPSQTAAPSSSPSASSSPLASPSLSPSPSPVPATPAPTPTPTINPAIPAVQLVRAFGGLSFTEMTGAVQAADGRWYVVEQAGRILTFREGDARATVFLDIRDHVTSGGETGLLGLALAPDFVRSGVFFVDYTRGGPLRTEIASFTSSSAVAD